MASMDKPLGSGQPPILIQPSQGQSIVIQEEDDGFGEAYIEEMDDGGMTIDFNPPISEDDGAEVPFDANLALHIKDEDLSAIASSLISNFDIDKESRADWEKTYKEGVALLGLSIEERTQPWDGASGITHPILAEAVVRFQSQAIGEIFPDSGPVKIKSVGKPSKDKHSQAIRVQDHMNYMVTEEMVEYREEMDRLLFALPVAGSAFKKVYHDPDLERLVAVFVPAENMVVSYGATSLHSATRVASKRILAS